MKILFVCTGNTCRSPMAEAIYTALGGAGEVGSRGLMAHQGAVTSPLARQVLLKALNLEFNKPAQAFKDEEAADLILTMTTGQRDFIKNLTGKSQVYALKEFVGETGDVLDPYGGDLADYEATFRELLALIKRVLKRIP